MQRKRKTAKNSVIPNQVPPGPNQPPDFRLLHSVENLLHGFRGYSVSDLRVELAGEELVQCNPAALDIDALGPGANDLQLALQPARLGR